ncbi:hypothetical protein AB0F42_24290 [Streptomyces buecherae]|uniref:hypothetical protein n=1 Tax=Streptomyces buecherae TaxID=2763006 RepID=UPI003400BB4D
MSALTIRIITCDGQPAGEVCDAEYGGDPATPSMTMLRRQARAEGWQTGPIRDNQAGGSA